MLLISRIPGLISNVSNNVFREKNLATENRATAHNPVRGDFDHVFCKRLVLLGGLFC